MIRSFKAKMTARIADGESPKGFPADLVRSAFRKLRLLNGAEELKDLASPPGNRLEALEEIEPGSIPFASTTNGGFAFAGRTGEPTMSK